MASCFRCGSALSATARLCSLALSFSGVCPEAAPLCPKQHAEHLTRPDRATGLTGPSSAPHRLWTQRGLLVQAPRFLWAVVFPFMLSARWPPAISGSSAMKGHHGWVVVLWQAGLSKGHVSRWLEASIKYKAQGRQHCQHLFPSLPGVCTCFGLAFGSLGRSFGQEARAHDLGEQHGGHRPLLLHQHAQGGGLSKSFVGSSHLRLVPTLMMRTYVPHWPHVPCFFFFFAGGHHTIGH